MTEIIKTFKFKKEFGIQNCFEYNVIVSMISYINF